VGKCLVARLIGDVPDPAEDRTRFRGQVQEARAAVGGIGAAFDPPGILHTVDLADQCHRPDFEQIGEAGLVDALIAREIAEGAALRPGQPEAARTPVLVEAPAEQARYVIDEKAETAVKIQRFHPEIGRLADDK
jgi:hypothetical protein